MLALAKFSVSIDYDEKTRKSFRRLPTELFIAQTKELF